MYRKQERSRQFCREKHAGRNTGITSEAGRMEAAGAGLAAGSSRHAWPVSRGWDRSWSKKVW